MTGDSLFVSFRVFRCQSCRRILVILGIILSGNSSSILADDQDAGVERRLFEDAALNFLIKDEPESEAERTLSGRLIDGSLSCGPAVDVQAIYYADLLTNTRGGISSHDSTRYAGLLDLGVTVDLERMDVPLPGQLYVLGQTTHGRGLTEEYVGDSLVLSDIDSFRNVTQLGEFWWEFECLEDSLTVRLGKQDVNTEFAYMETATHFVQSSFELTPNSTLPTYPQQSMAAVALIPLNSSLIVKAGVWDALGSPESFWFSGNEMMFLVGELEYRYQLSDDVYPGTLSLTAGYQTSGQTAGQQLDAVHGYAIQWEQMLFRESGSESNISQGLTLFSAWYPRFFGTNRPSDSIGNSASGGLVYTGLLPARNEDSVGAGVSWGQLFHGGSDQETVFEVFYRAELGAGVSLQPDLQYIATPSGIYPDALVVGVRFQMEL